MFDAGEGAATLLSNKIYAVKNIFLTHGHVDHISGIWSIINTRNNAMGDREKPLTIYYPEKNRGIEMYLDFIKRVNGELRFELNYHPFKESEKIFLRKSGTFERYVLPFRVDHTYNEISYGFQVVDVRTRLKEEFKNLTSKEITDIVKEKGRDYVTETYEKKILTISGDTLGLKKEDIKDTEVLFHECTFFKEEDRKYNNHASLSEIVELVKDTDVKTLVLYHISSRYNRIIEKILKDVKIDGVEIYYVHPERIFKL